MSYLGLFIFYFFNTTEYCLQMTDPPLIFDGHTTSHDHMEASNEDQEREIRGEALFCEIEQYLTKAKDIIVEQHSRRNYRFIGNVWENFTGVRDFVDEIEQYRRRLTNPVLSEHTATTLFLE